MTTINEETLLKLMENNLNVVIVVTKDLSKVPTEIQNRAVAIFDWDASLEP